MRVGLTGLQVWMLWSYDDDDDDDDDDGGGGGGGDFDRTLTLPASFRLFLGCKFYRLSL